MTEAVVGFEAPTNSDPLPTPGGSGPLSAAEWAERASRVRPREELFIDGRWTPARAGGVQPSTNPATGAVIAQVASGRAEDVDVAVAAARAAFQRGDWSRAAPADRKRVLLRLADLVEANAEELALLDTLDAGKLISETTGVDVPGTAATFRWFAEAVDKVYGQVAPTGPGDLALVTREPLGVIAAIVPWNYPLEIAAWKLAPALAVGNSVVLKPAEESPLSVLRLAELARDAGLPDGVLNVVPGPGPVVGQALGRHHDVDAIAFTGSTAVGRLLQVYAGESNMKQVWLEAGGKSPDLVFADAADLDAAAAGVIQGIFYNAGQVCSATSRLLVERSIKDALLDRVVELGREIVVGDPLDPSTGMGPLVSEKQVGAVLDHIESARTSSHLVLGGERLEREGCFVGPTIFDEVPRGSRLALEEVFGPVLGVFTFDHENDAVATANSGGYGLAASLWTDNLSRAHRVASRLRVGTVSVNTVDALDVTTPFGGFGLSGNARDLSLHAFDQYSALKTTWVRY
ncbi:aldehyde dehydrogenase family protein [Modestobacter sp. VKM Ac-2978]|uniref:aldehyde dehydrogenase family protein n=1 Tax=Modestobacter sp. VKM Ac-2978 TaxID=3004132 RepID=UPI0022AA35A1|nr:aldehyde dehydrogenase family protein [Modestobacter sp. VKM Ac-2978]MCZ2849831.1 aldehyde dehydrogenase family protein [Modestobacter sp. VKM Ac-2978]